MSFIKNDEKKSHNHCASKAALQYTKSCDKRYVNLTNVRMEWLILLSEKSIENKIKAYLKTIDRLFFWKEHGGMYGTAGIPDIICCYKGMFLAFEVKREDGVVSEVQMFVMDRIKKCGGSVYVVKSLDEVKEIINTL